MTAFTPMSSSTPVNQMLDTILLVFLNDRVPKVKNFEKINKDKSLLKIKLTFGSESAGLTNSLESKIWQGLRSDPYLTAKCVENSSYSKQK